MKFAKKPTIFIVTLLALVFLGSGTSLAVGLLMPDDTRPGCDTTSHAAPYGCTKQSLVVGETQFVRNAKQTTISAWLTKPSGQITIYDPNFCASGSTEGDGVQNADKADYASFFRTKSGTYPLGHGGNVVTEYRLYSSSGALVGSYDGKVKSSCVSESAPINVSGLNLDADTGRYQVKVVATHKDIFSTNFDGITNGYTIKETVNGYVVTYPKTVLNGRDVNMKAASSSGHYDLDVYFGSDCTIVNPKGQAVTLWWWDMDNGGKNGGAQVAPWITMTLQRRASGSTTWVNVPIDINGTPSGSQPPTSVNTSGYATFKAYPNYDYHWVWNNIYGNNTIQYSIPFDGIYYFSKCNTQIEPGVVATPQPPTTITVGQPATFTLNRTITGYLGTALSATYNVNYRLNKSGPWLAIPTAVSGIYDARNKTLNITGDTVDASGDPGPANFSPTITFPANFAPSGTSSICVQLDLLTLSPGLVAQGDPAEDCVNIVNPGSYTVSASQATYEKGTGGAGASVVYNLIRTSAPCNGADTVIWKPGTAAARTISVPADCANPPAATIDTFTDTASAATLDAQPVGLYTNGGAYKANIVSINSVASAISASGGVKVYEVPYARFFGNDIYACGGSGAVPDGKIVFNVSNVDASKGAAVEYAALALSGFGNAPSGIITTALGHGAANALMGSLSDSTKTPCNADVSGYYPSTVTGIVGNTVPGAAGYYTANGNINLTGGTSSQKVTIHATGNITISGNNIGATGAPAVPFVNNNNVPYVLIVADGNIYIDPSVTTINAVLVAGGTISTCSTASSLTTPATSALAGSCNNPLTINGALSAKDIKFRRAVGTRLLNNTPAEQVNFPAYLHFATPFLDDTSQKGYQSLFNAPPYL